MKRIFELQCSRTCRQEVQSAEAWLQAHVPSCVQGACVWRWILMLCVLMLDGMNGNATRKRVTNERERSEMTCLQRWVFVVMIWCSSQLDGMGRNTTRTEVANKMERFGRIKFVEMIKIPDKSNRTDCSAIVRFDRASFAKDALQVRPVLPWKCGEDYQDTWEERKDRMYCYCSCPKDLFRKKALPSMPSH